jgi:hypothetical protein
VDARRDLPRLRTVLGGAREIPGGTREITAVDPAVREHEEELDGRGRVGLAGAPALQHRDGERRIDCALGELEEPLAEQSDARAEDVEGTAGQGRGARGVEIEQRVQGVRDTAAGRRAAGCATPRRRVRTNAARAAAALRIVSVARQPGRSASHR